MAQDNGASATQTGLSSLRDPAPTGLAHSASIPSAETTALATISELAQHCAFAAAALPPTEETMMWLGRQFAEIMDVADEAQGLQAKHWGREESPAPVLGQES